METWSEFKLYRKKNFFYFQVFSLFSNLLLLVMPIFSLQIYNRVLTSQSTDTLLYLVIITAILVAVQIGMDYIRQQILNNMASVYDSLFDQHIVNRSIAVSSKNTSLSQMLFKDHQLAKQYIASPFHRTLTDLPWTGIFIIVLFLLHPALGAFALLSTIILAVISGVQLLMSHQNGLQAKNLSVKQSISLQQLFGKGRLFKAHFIAERIVERWKHRNNLVIEQEVSAKVLVNRGQSWIKLLRMLVQIGVFALGAWLVIEGQIMSGSMIASSILLARILSPIDQGANHFFSWRESRQAYDRIDKLFDQVSSDDKMDIDLDSLEVMVDKLSYQGIGDRLLLKNISFNLKAGSCLLVNGESGSGKSLLLKLLASSIEPTDGAVKINGISTSKISPKRLAESMVFLPQIGEVFNASVADNISGFERGEEVSQKIVNASRLAFCHQFIAKLPNGYSTLLGQDGIELSASEKQRISIASCLYNRPKLLILDDPTSFLQAEATRSLIDQLAELKQSGSTIVMVTSSPDLQSLADYVVELKDGVVIKGYQNKPQAVAAVPNKKNDNVVTPFSPQAMKF
jgi:ATP-binding cassette, subfamily C, bacterial exporter for protease/lipase